MADKSNAIIAALKGIFSGVKTGGAQYWRLILLIIILGSFTMGVLSIYKGCEWTGKNSHLKVKGAPGAIR